MTMTTCHQQRQLLLCGGILLLLTVATRAAAAEDDINPNTKKIYLPGAAGSGPYPILLDWISAFETKYPESDLSVSSVGSGAAQSALWGDINCVKKPIDGLCNDIYNNGTLEITSLRGSGSPDLGQPTTIWGAGGGTFDDEHYVDEEDRGLLQLPVFGNPVLVTYSKDVTGDLGSKTSKPFNLSSDVIAGIFNNSILYWDDPAIQNQNPNLVLPSNQRITVVVRSDKSGMSQCLTQYVEYNNPTTWPEEAVGKSPDWPLANLTHASETTGTYACADNVTFCNLQADGQTGIGVSLLRRPYSIGYLELGYYSTLTQFVGQAHVSSRSHPDRYELATIETLRTTMAGLADALDEEDAYALNLATSPTPPGGYPISRYIYYYIKTKAQEYQNCYEAWLMYKFLEWGYTDPIAEEIALLQGQVTPPREVVQKALEGLEKIQCVVAEGEDYEDHYARGDVISASTFTPPPYRATAEDHEDSLQQVLVPTLVVVAFALIATGAAVYFYYKYKQKKESPWNIAPEELSFAADPPPVIGNGSFGMVLLANYRNTQVAVKRLIPPSTGISESHLTGDHSCDDEQHPADDPDHHRKRQDGPGVVLDGLHDLEEGMDDDKTGLHTIHSWNKTWNTHTTDRSNFIMGGIFRKDEFAREVKTLSKLRHPNIVTIIGACEMMPEGSEHWQGSSPLIVMEYMHHGSLQDILLNDTVPIDGSMLLPILRDISQGICFLHHTNPPIIHGDLKSANILVDRTFRAKVGDFGLARKTRNGVRAGTPFWMAPELLMGLPNSAASDVYAFGVIVNEMYSRKRPFNDDQLGTDEILKQVMDPKINKRPTVPPLTPPEVVSIMQNCWSADPELRPTMGEIDRGLKRLNVKNVEPIADYYPCVTLIVANIHGFQAWSSEREPTQVFQLLEEVYQAFDAIADRLGVFKVDTNAGTYIAATGLPKQRDDHAEAAVQFAYECSKRMHELCKKLESSLGPSTSSLSLQVGTHTGPVTAGALQGEHSRFQLFGDTMDVASQMGRTCDAGMIHISQSTANNLNASGKSSWFEQREGRTHIDGKGEVQTFYAVGPWDVRFFQSNSYARQLERLVEWNTEQLFKLLENLVSSRNVNKHGAPTEMSVSARDQTKCRANPIEEVTELVTMPTYMRGSANHVNYVELGANVKNQLKNYVAAIAATYNRNAFHNFEHASHVSMSAFKMLRRIIKHPEDSASSDGSEAVAEHHHMSTFGISSDALLQFAVVFACLIHDCDHQGVSNAQLVLEGQDVATLYKGKCVAEQNSLDLAWDILTGKDFQDLRACICPTGEEQQRFRMLMVNTVIATDISDKEFNMKRKERWNKAFQDTTQKHEDGDLKATIVLEYIIQASDIAHTMQHVSIQKRRLDSVWQWQCLCSLLSWTLKWSVYKFWNEKLFEERYLAWLDGREPKNPVEGWYEGEIGFFDFYIIPLARKLETCGVFGVSSDEYLQYALTNRDEWETKGREVVAAMVEKYCSRTKKQPGALVEC